MQTLRKFFGNILGSATGKTSAPTTTRRVRLALESLDDRLAPSSLIDTGIADPTAINFLPFSSQTGTATSTLIATTVVGGVVSTPPQVVNFTGVMILGGLYELSGDVIDVSPGGLTITFGGEPDTLRGMTVTTDANGHFELTKLLRTDGSDSGVVSAQTVNAQGATSNLALTIIRPG